MIVTMENESQWQSETQLCGVVLREVFPWLSGRELARAGATCRTWRRAACDPPLWRRLLMREGGDCDWDAGAGAVCWRQEYVCARAGWSLQARHAAGAGAALLHADLAPGGVALALAAADASVGVWRRERGAWRPAWRLELRARGWASAARVQWAAGAPRLLAAGPRLLLDDWELMVLQADEASGGARVLSRVRCGAGAAGCWAGRGGGAFLSLELRLLAPRAACTTVWLNAATQEMQSEYAGVTTALLRIFNEEGAHITHAIVAGEEECGGSYFIAASAPGLSAWRLAALRPPPLCAGAPGELAARARRRRQRIAQPPLPADAPAPDEAQVRAACAPPLARCALGAAPVGLALAGGAGGAGRAGGTVLVSLADGGVRRVCGASLAPLAAYLPAGPAPAAPPAPAHYVQPAASTQYVASPAGALSPRVRLWAARSGARARGVCAGGRGGGAALCALLPAPPAPAAPATLLVLAADALYVWRSRATPQSPPDC